MVFFIFFQGCSSDIPEESPADITPGPTTFSANPGDANRPENFPDESSLICQVNNPRARMFSVKADGSAEPSPLTWVEFGSEPSISPTGKFLLFIAQFEREPNLWVIDIAGETHEARPILPGNRAQYQPVWSPDGDRIAFIQNPGGGPVSRNLWSLDPEGTNPEQITHVGGIRNVVWCSTGEIIASVDPAATTNHAIWRLDSNGTPSESLIDTDGNDQVTDCSPDGKSILYTSVIDGASIIFVMNLEDGTTWRLGTGLSHASGARWSPDGSEIAFRSSAEGTLDLYVIPSEGGARRRITHSQGRESWPTWSPSGGDLIYSRTDGRLDLHMLPVKGQLGK
jgi:Tol biopolymer transport system component